MRVITKIVIDMETFETVERVDYSYSGPVAECKKGGGSSQAAAPEPEPPPPPPKSPSASSQAAREDQQQQRQKRRGQRSTIMTGGQGMEEKAKTGKKLLSGTA